MIREARGYMLYNFGPRDHAPETWCHDRRCWGKYCRNGGFGDLRRRGDWTSEVHADYRKEPVARLSVKFYENYIEILGLFVADMAGESKAE